MATFFCLKILLGHCISHTEFAIGLDTIDKNLINRHFASHRILNVMFNEFTIKLDKYCDLFIYQDLINGVIKQ